jgi:hypothetical protein
MVPTYKTLGIYKSKKCRIWSPFLKAKIEQDPKSIRKVIVTALTKPCLMRLKALKPTYILMYKSFLRLYPAIHVFPINKTTAKNLVFSKSEDVSFYQG